MKGILVKDSNLTKKAHRLAVAINPNPDYQTDWPDIKLAKISQKTVALNVIDCIRKLDAVYNTTSLGAIINHLPKFHTALSQLLATMQAQVLTYRNTQPPLWRRHAPAPLQPIFPKTMPTSYERTNLYQIIYAMQRINTSADLSQDFNPSLFPVFKAIHMGLTLLLLRPDLPVSDWADTLPKFTATPLDTLATGVPAKFFTPAPYTPEWRRQQREQYHKQRGDNRPNQTSAKRGVK